MNLGMNGMLVGGVGTLVCPLRVNFDTGVDYFMLPNFDQYLLRFR
jgi:hypothetical protein